MPRKVDLGVSAVALLFASGGVIAPASAASRPDVVLSTAVSATAASAGSTRVVPQTRGADGQSGWRADSRDYVWIDTADRLLEAIGDAPPDFVFDFRGEDAWGWETNTGNHVLAEASGSDSVRYYYYDAGGEAPFLVQERHLSFAFQDDGLIAVYDETGALLPPSDTDDFDADAAELFERGAHLRYEADREEQWDAVDAGWWAGQIALVFDMRQRWDIGRTRHPAWVNWYRSPDSYRWQTRLSQERDRRRQDGLRFRTWQQSGFRGAVPRFDGRPVPRPGRTIPGIRAPQRDAAGRPIITRPGTPRPRILRPAPTRPDMVRPGASRPGGAQVGPTRPGGAQTGPSRPGGPQTGPTRPGAGRPDAGRPGLDRPNGARPGNLRPPITRPQSGQPNFGQGRPGAVAPGVPRPGASTPPRVPGQIRPDWGRPQTGRPGAGRPDAGPPQTGRPELGRPQAGGQDGGRTDRPMPQPGTTRPAPTGPDQVRPQPVRVIPVPPAPSVPTTGGVTPVPPAQTRPVPNRTVPGQFTPGQRGGDQLQRRRMPDGAAPRETPPIGRPVQLRPTPQAQPVPQGRPAVQPTPQPRPQPQSQQTPRAQPAPQPTAQPRQAQPRPTATAPSRSFQRPDGANPRTANPRNANPRTGSTRNQE